MNPWYGTTTTEKILAWRELRQECFDKSDDEIIDAVNKWWTYSPWVRLTINQYAPDSWPTPWEMLEKGEVCRSAIALGQAYTLWICAPNMNVELYLVNNYSEKEIHLVVVIDSKMMLNYTQGQILDKSECDYELLNIIKKSDLTHIKL